MDASDPTATAPRSLDVALVIAALDISGGSQRQLLMLARELQALGHRVRVVAARYDPSRCYPELCAGLRIEALETIDDTTGADSATTALGKEGRGEGYRRRLVLARELARRVQSGHVDVVNIHDIPGFGLGAYLDDSPAIVWMLNDAPVSARILKRVRRGSHPLSAIQAAFRPSAAVNRMTCAALDRVDQIVVLDSRNREMTNRYLQLDARVVRSGVALPADVPVSRESPRPDEPLRLFSVGILFPHRRFEDLMRAAALVKNRGRTVRLRIVGRSHLAPAYARQLRNLMRELDLVEDIEMIESLTEKEMVRSYRDAHVFVFPHAPQTWGLSTFEAMANGTPVVLTTGCGASEVVKNGVHAVVTSPFAPAELAEAICGLHGERWQDIRGRALELVRNRLTWRHYAMNMAAVFLKTAQTRTLVAGNIN